MGRIALKPILQTWGRTLRGHVPSLSLEITRECPLRCPGCYAYEDAHLGTTNLRSLSDFRGEELIRRVREATWVAIGLALLMLRRRSPALDVPGA